MKIFFEITIFFLYLAATSGQQIHVYFGNILKSSEANATLYIQVSMVNISLICQLENFFRWEKVGGEVYLDRRVHFPFFSFNHGGVYFCQDNVSSSLFINLIPTGSGVFMYSRIAGSYQMLNNLSEIVGPFEADAIISCAISKFNASTQISWYSSIDEFDIPLPISPPIVSPLIPPISSYPSANGTVLDIYLGFFFRSLDNEAVYLCIAPNQDGNLAMYFFTIYSKPPVYLVISNDHENVTFKRDILSGSFSIHSIPLHSNLSFDCQVFNPEIILPTGKVLIPFLVSNFLFSDIGLYECRESLDTTVSIKVEIIIGVYILISTSQQPLTPLCDVTFGSCILPIGTENISIRCFTSSKSLLWDIPSTSNVNSNRSNDILQVFQLDFLNSGFYSCRDLIYDTQIPGQVNLISSGIFVVFTNEDDHHSTMLVEEDTVIISSSFTLSCFVGSMEIFSNFSFSYLSRDLDTYTLRNETSQSLHLQFTQFGHNDDGYYTCGSHSGNDPNITVRLISFKSVPSISQLNISVLHIASNYISLMWNDISYYENNGNVLEYILNFKINDTSPFTQIFGIKGFSYTLTSLLPSSLYEISISARNSFGIGSPSSSLFVKTLYQDNSPIGVTFSYVTSDSFILSWRENPFLDKNVVHYSLLISGEKRYFTLTRIPQQIIQVLFNQTTTTVDNLIPDTYYSVTIVTIYQFGDEDFTKYVIQTLEGDLSVSSPHATLKESTNSNEILISLTETDTLNAEILFHLLIVFVVKEDVEDIELGSISFSGISAFQNPYSIDSHYIFILVNISSSCSFPHSITTSSLIDPCLSQNGRYTNPKSINGYFYQFMLRAVTRKMNIFDSSPTTKLLVPISSTNPKFQSNIIYATISALLIILLLALCAILVFVAFLLSSNHYDKKERFHSVPQKNFSFSQSIENKAVNSSDDEKDSPSYLSTDMPPALLSHTTLSFILFSRIGGNIDIRLPQIGGSIPISITWMKDNEFVGEDDYISITSNSDILIRDIQRKHAGIYVCIAQNNYGRIEIPITVEIHGAVQTAELFTYEDENVASTFIPVGDGSDDILLCHYGNYLKTMHFKNNQGFKREYIELIEHIPGTSNSVSKDIVNKTKNRYANIYSYNHSRVILLPIPDYEEYSHDYINASFIDGVCQASQYISAQGPLNNTIGDMWRLIWQERIGVIVMLTKLREGEKIKCSCYWPEVDSLLTLGPFTIHHISTENNLCFIRRRFVVENVSEIGIKRNVLHFQFIAWPDFGVPEISSLLEFHRIVILEYNTLLSSKGPLLIHCSAGVGRSGTFIVIDNMMKKLEVDGSINIHSFVNKMRMSRSKMIQTLEQYIFCHDALLVASICRKPIFNYTLVLRQDIESFVVSLQCENEQNTTPCDIEFQALNCISLQPQDVPCHFAISNLEKNRNPIYLPPDYSTVSLTSTRGYINAAFVDGYRHKHAFIVAQTPIPATVVDFWRLVADYEILTIVMLFSEPHSSEDEYYQYWPNLGITHQLSDMQISMVSTEETPFGCYQRIILVNTKLPGDFKNVLEIDHYIYTDWFQDNTPFSYSTFASFVYGLSRKSQCDIKGTVLVHCSDSVQKSAVFVSSCYCFERLDYNDTIDVFQAAKYLRYCKPGSFQRESQYLAIYKTIQAFLKFEESF